jgi:RNA polymerase sigma factor (sigma-70 family)
MAFPKTRWTLIRQAASTPTLESRAALEELCCHYREPVLAFVRRRVATPESAEDLTQEFFSRLIRGELLARANPDRGQFRSFLLNAVRDFLADARDHDNAQKRGGHIRHVSLSIESIGEPMTNLSPDQEFDVRWARTVLQRSLDRVQQEYSDGRSSLFESLKTSLDGSNPMNGRQLAETLKMSEGAVRVALHRMRQRLGILIREEIAETVPSGTDIDDEILKLRQTLETSR